MINPCLFTNINYTRFKIMIYGDNLILSAKIYNENFSLPQIYCMIN